MLLERAKAEYIGENGQWVTATQFKLNNGINNRAELFITCFYSVNHTFSTFSPHLLQKNRTRMMDITHSCMKPNCGFSSSGAKNVYYNYLFYCLIHSGFK